MVTMVAAPLEAQPAGVVPGRIALAAGLLGVLGALLTGLGQSLSETSNALTVTYFTHAERPYRLVEEEL